MTWHERICQRTPCCCAGLQEMRERGFCFAALRVRKNGIVRGDQRYRCRACSYNFTDTPPRGYPLTQKVTAVLL
jgi:hypothetical protein